DEIRAAMKLTAQASSTTRSVVLRSAAVTWRNMTGRPNTDSAREGASSTCSYTETSVGKIRALADRFDLLSRSCGPASPAKSATSKPCLANCAVVARPSPADARIRRKLYLPPHMHSSMSLKILGWVVMSRPVGSGALLRHLRHGIKGPGSPRYRLGRDANRNVDTLVGKR